MRRQTEKSLHERHGQGTSPIDAAGRGGGGVAAYRVRGLVNALATIVLAFPRYLCPASWLTPHLPCRHGEVGPQRIAGPAESGRTKKNL